MWCCPMTACNIMRCPEVMKLRWLMGSVGWVLPNCYPWDPCASRRHDWKPLTGYWCAMAVSLIPDFITDPVLECLQSGQRVERGSVVPMAGQRVAAVTALGQPEQF